MDAQGKKIVNNNQKQPNRKTSKVFFVASVILFCIFIYLIFQSCQDKTGNLLGPAILVGVVLILCLALAGISLSFFFKSKLNKKNVILRNISTKSALGVILIALIFSKRFIMFNAQHNLLFALRLSFIDGLIIATGLVLIALGFRKP